MRMAYFKKTALIFAFQFLCIACAFRGDIKSAWLGKLFSTGTWIVPFVGYIAVLYTAPMFEKIPRALKMICLTLLSVFATIVGVPIIIVTLALAGVRMMSD